jgi:succinate-semialdehyde dehydrogenase / glutarate-semialdehyde dehydrogenase
MPIATINPTTGETVETFDPHDGREVERRLRCSADAAVALRDCTFAQRAEWMRGAAAILEADIDTTAAMITLEMGKPITQAVAEVSKSIAGMRFYADRAEFFLADRPLDEPESVHASRAWTAWQPMGTVLAVMPWNFPLWQVMRFAAPALMAGNAGLLKHASNVPRAALYLESLFAKAGFPPGSFQTLFVSSADIADIIADDRVAAVTVTGSEQAGRSIAGTAGANIKKSVLELGGSDPFIVMPSADLEEAAATAVRARVQNNGQSCIAAKRFIVHTEIYDTFMERFVDGMARLTLGDPAAEETDVGPLATQSGREELARLVQDAVGNGAEVLLGASAPDRKGWFYPPTVLTGLTEQMRIVSQEAFGPVASVYRVHDQAEAVRVANQTAFGLSSAVWTHDTEQQQFFIRGLAAGAVFINGMSESTAELPFGGVKNSGYGREMSEAGIREFCNLKAIWKA